MTGGRLFQTRGPATANALSPSDVVMQGMSSIVLVATVNQDDRGQQDGRRQPDIQLILVGVITVLSNTFYTGSVARVATDKLAKCLIRDIQRPYGTAHSKRFST